MLVPSPMVIFLFVEFQINLPFVVDAVSVDKLIIGDVNVLLVKISIPSRVAKSASVIAVLN